MRRERARATRDSVIAAAAIRFASDGYVATTVDAVAVEAGVSRATVFNAVGGKPELLRAAYRAAVRGAQPGTPLGEQPRSLQILAETDPARLLEGYAAVVAAIAPRLAPLYEAIRAAAGADGEAAQLWEELQKERHSGADRVVAALERLGALRGDLDRRSAADILWVLNDPGLHRLLVKGRGWRTAAFQDWLAETMQSQLLLVTGATHPRGEAGQA